MKIRGTLIAVLFLLIGILAALVAQVQNVLTESPETSGTEIASRPDSGEPLLSRDFPGTDGSEPTTSRTTPADPGTSAPRPQTDPEKQTTSVRPKTEPEKQTTSVRPKTDPPQTSKTQPTTQLPATDPPDPGPTAPSAELGFLLDLSAYEKYMNPTGDDWSDEYLLLLNAAHPVSKDYEKTLPFLKNIVRMNSVSGYPHEHYKSGQQLNATALQALTAMFLEAKAEGIPDLYSTSAYRSYAYQITVFNRNVDKTNGYRCESCGAEWIGKSNVCPDCGVKSATLREVTKAEKEDNVATYSCRPGTSDHQTGLALDIIQSSLPSRFGELIQEFGETKAGKWLAENSWKFGFVLRFPADKEDVTGIIYEPWHFRFVGREHAARMTEMGLCLEEYVEYLEQTGYFNR